MKKISKRCGKGNCEFYNKHNNISGCFKFDDRNDCGISGKHRRKSANKSRKQNELHTFK